jgi:hypothetical protein
MLMKYPLQEGLEALKIFIYAVGTMSKRSFVPLLYVVLDFAIKLRFLWISTPHNFSVKVETVILIEECLLLTALYCCQI